MLILIDGVMCSQFTKGMVYVGQDYSAQMVDVPLAHKEALLVTISALQDAAAGKRPAKV